MRFIVSIKNTHFWCALGSLRVADRDFGWNTGTLHTNIQNRFYTRRYSLFPSPTSSINIRICLSPSSVHLPVATRSTRYHNSNTSIRRTNLMLKNYFLGDTTFSLALFFFTTFYDYVS